jgi:hypothetical protein
MKWADQIIHSISWRLYRSERGIAIMRALRRVVPMIFPYHPPRSPLSVLATNPRYRVETGPSTVEGAGTGLFALETIPAGEVVGEYGGDRVDSLVRWLRLKNKDYLMTTGITSLMVDAANRPEMTMRYVNHHFDPARLNLVRKEDGGTVYLVSTRVIEVGEELFFDYGGLYWKLRGVG